jgi:hypothetical protein
MFCEWVPDYLRDEGLTVHLLDGWERRSRSSSPDGLDVLWGHVVHHTVSSMIGREQEEAERLALFHEVAPVGNTFLPRSGEWWVLAAGATNTNGEGGPYQTARGTIAFGNGNRTMWATEAANGGTGEPWPEVQQESYVRGCAAFAKGATIETPGGPFDASCFLAHSEWAPTRKVDPAGPAQFTQNQNREWADFIWSPGVDGMDKFRGRIFELLIPDTGEFTMDQEAKDAFAAINTTLASLVKSQKTQNEAMAEFRSNLLDRDRDQNALIRAAATGPRELALAVAAAAEAFTEALKVEPPA